MTWFKTQFAKVAQIFSHLKAKRVHKTFKKSLVAKEKAKAKANYRDKLLVIHSKDKMKQIDKTNKAKEKMNSLLE